MRAQGVLKGRVAGAQASCPGDFLEDRGTQSLSSLLVRQEKSG